MTLLMKYKLMRAALVVALGGWATALLALWLE
jgi:hypothetical protein